MYCKVRPEVFLNVCWLVGFELPTTSTICITHTQSLLSLYSNPITLLGDTWENNDFISGAAAGIMSVSQLERDRSLTSRFSRSKVARLQLSLVGELLNPWTSLLYVAESLAPRSPFLLYQLGVQAYPFPFFVLTSNTVVMITHCAHKPSVKHRGIFCSIPC